MKPHIIILSSKHIVQELRESRGGRPGLSILTSLLVSVDVKLYEPCFGIGLSLSLIRQLTSEDIKQHYLPCLLNIVSSSPRVRAKSNSQE